MVQIVENWSAVRGAVTRLASSDDVAGFEEVQLDITEAGPVPGFPHLLGDIVGTAVTVLFPRDLVRALDLAPGRVVACRVRLAARRRIYVSREQVTVE